MFSGLGQTYSECVAAIDPNVEYFMDPMINCNRLLLNTLPIPTQTPVVVAAEGLGVGSIALIGFGLFMAMKR